MSFKSKAQNLFPHAVFTGGSGIHASIARQGMVPLDFSQPRLVMKTIKEAKFSAYVDRVINKHCPHMEWLISGDEFNDLLMVDFYRLLQGMSTLETKQRLKNPSTGNYFHRITLMEEEMVVGGVRVWLIPYGEQTSIGFRFRLEGITEEVAKVRQKARQKAVATEQEIIEVQEYVAKEEKEVTMAFEDFLQV